MVEKKKNAGKPKVNRLLFPPTKVETKLGGTKRVPNHLKGNAITGRECMGDLVQRSAGARPEPRMSAGLLDHAVNPPR